METTGLTGFHSYEICPEIWQIIIPEMQDLELANKIYMNYNWL